MYTKLFSRITESSLMEEDIPVRYTFVMLLAIADPTGLVVGTDIAIARRLNMPISEFERCVKALASPDEDSNSKEEEGRRLVNSDGERGYQIVNFVKYRDLKDDTDRREYMREYMRKRRGSKVVTEAVNTCKLPLTQLTHEDEDEDEDEDKDSANAGLFTKEKTDPTNKLSPEQIRLGSLFGRRPTTAWSKKEKSAFKAIGEIKEDDLRMLERYYQLKIAENKDFRRTSLLTLLNNFNGELDRSRNHKENKGF